MLLTLIMTLVMGIGSFFGVEPEATNNTVTVEESVVEIEDYTELVKESFEEMGWTDVIVWRENENYEVWGSYDIGDQHFWATEGITISDDAEVTVNYVKVETFDEKRGVYVISEMSEETGGEWITYTRGEA